MNFWYNEDMHSIVAKVENRNKIAENTFEMVFSIEEDSFSFDAGQYVWLVLPKLDFPDPKGERRAFSITSSPLDKTRIVVQYRDSDSGYKKTLKNLTQGSTVQILGPFGSSYVPRPEQQKIVLIAGGVGIAPFLSILRSQDQSASGRFKLIYVNSSPDAGVYFEELKKITTDRNVPFINHIGSFKENLFPSDIDWMNDYFYVCGPIGMVDAVYKILASHNVPFEKMHFEQHYPAPIGNLTEQDFIQKPGERNIMLQAIHDSKNHVIVTDANGQIIFANKTAEVATGFTFDEMRGNTPRLWGGIMPLEFYHSFWHKKHDAGGFDGEITNRRKNGDIYTVISHISPITGDSGAVIGYIGTEEDITKEKQLDKAKTEFLSLASHQLRTPLSTINWYCEMLLAGDAGPVNDEQKKFLEEAYGGSQRMVQLVTALLNVSRIETGTYMVEPEKVDVVRLARSVLDESKPKIDEKKLTVKLEKENIPEMMLDPNLTTMIFQNLLTNSVKYTPVNGTVAISLKVLHKDDKVPGEIVDQDSLLIQVADNGMGIPRNQKNEIFTKLFRADNVRKADTEGTGLGLYLIKSLIEQSHGKIWFESEEGKGTTFYVLIPLSGMIKKEGEKKLNQ